jgi:hypothetical protein
VLVGSCTADIFQGGLDWGSTAHSFHISQRSNSKACAESSAPRGCASGLLARPRRVAATVSQQVMMLRRNACHRSRATTPFTSCSKPNSSRACQRLSAIKQQPTTASRCATVHCECIHKEYAQQGWTAAQQEAPAAAAGTTGGQQLLSVPEDIVLECLTILRCDQCTDSSA